MSERSHLHWVSATTGWGTFGLGRFLAWLPWGIWTSQTICYRGCKIGLMVSWRTAYLSGVLTGFFFANPNFFKQWLIDFLIWYLARILIGPLGHNQQLLFLAWQGADNICLTFHRSAWIYGQVVQFVSAHGTLFFKLKPKMHLEKNYKIR